jgi:flagellin
VAGIATNFGALTASTSLSRASRSLGISSERLSTGLRINSAKDDAAGLAISQGMTASIRGLSVAIRNVNDGISLTQIAESSLRETSQMVQRMRELAVQSANGSMSGQNRIALQAEFDQLLSQVDKVAQITNFNDIKLLDGTNQNALLQTGDKAINNFAVALSKADSRALGLRGFAPEGQLTSGRVTNPTGIAANAILISGKNWTTNAGATALSSTDAASTISSAINANIGEHNVLASAYNLIRGETPTASSFASGDLIINGFSIGAARDIEELVTNINRDVSGVIAYLNPDETISLSNDTGKQISISGTSPSKAGFVAATTYQGFVTLNRLDHKDIIMEPANRAAGFPIDYGTVADLQKIGFNAAIGSSHLSGAAVSSSLPSQSDQVLINGVRVDTPKAASASAKAAAINAVSDESGVTAKTKTAVELTLDFTHKPKSPVKQITTYAVYPGSDDTDKYEITINGHKLTIDSNDSGTGIENVKASILGNDLRTKISTVTGSQNRASALASGLASIINADMVMSSLVRAEGMPDGTLKITANRAGDEIISDLKATNASSSSIPAPTFSYTPTGTGNGSLTGSFPTFTLRSANNNNAGSYVYSSSSVGVGISFNWNYTTLDRDGARYDPAGYILNAVKTQLSDDNLAQNQSGSGTINLTYAAGSTFGWYVETSDGVLGEGVLNISNAVITPGPPVIVSGTDDQFIVRGQSVQKNVFDDAQSFRINGKAIDISSALNIHDMVTLINANAPSGVTARADKSGHLILESTSGENIAVENLSMQSGKFVQSVRSITGEVFVPEASFRFGGTIESDDVAVVTINGEKLAIQTSSSDAGTVANRVAAAINSHGVLGAQMIASATTDGKVMVTGMAALAGYPMAVRVEFLEANAFAAGTIGKGGGVDQISYDGTIPVDGQTITLLSNGITSFGSIALESKTGAEIRIEDRNNGLSAAKYGLSLQGERIDLIGGTINILTQTNSGIAMRAIDAAIDKLNLRMGDLGAVQNKLEAKIGILTSTNLNMEAARSRILDTDYATETTSLTKAQVIQQAATAMLAQANGQAQTVLSLLK